MAFEIFYAPDACKDALKLKRAGLKEKASKLLDIIAVNPFCNPLPYEKLVGDLTGVYSRRINRQHRLLYEVDKTKHIVRVLRMWTHYE